MSTIEKAVNKLGKGQEAERPEAKEEALRSDAGERPGQPRSEDAPAQRRRVDLRRLQELGYLTPGTTNNGLVEEYRMIKRPLLRNAFDHGLAAGTGANLVMVTSSVPGEGKTFNALNLALSMALERDYTVLLVDADTVNPNLTELMAMTDAPGLIDRLADPARDLGDLILGTDIDKLRVLPAGTPHSHSTELLASREMQQVAAELSQRYQDRVVIFDTPPLLATSQAHVLARLVGQVLVVVEADRTPQYMVSEAVSYLDSDKSIGMVLNKSRHAFGDYYGSSYYGYGSGSSV